MYKLSIIVSFVFCSSFIGIAQQKNNVHEYAKRFLLSNYREQILDPKIWHTSDTTKIDWRFSIHSLDSATNNGKRLHIYHLMTNVTEVGLHFLLIVEDSNKSERVKILGEDSNYQQVIANLIDLKSLAKEFNLKHETLLECYQMLLDRYNYPEMRNLIKPFQDTIR
jgi:hypothetical protein